MRFSSFTAFFALSVAACTGTVTDGQPGIRLSLSSGDDGDRLVLEGSPADPGYRADYANPGRLARMTVTLFGDGKLVGLCQGDDASSRSCDDVPFFSNVSFDGEGRKVLRVWDVKGALVVDYRCTAGDPVCAARGGACTASGSDDVGTSCAPECLPSEYGEGCFNGLDDDCDGLPDCADADCNAKCDEAGVGGDGDGDGSGDSDSDDGADSDADGGGDGDGATPPSACPPPPPATDCAAVETWARACFCQIVNDNLSEYSVDTVFDCSELTGTYEGPEDWRAVNEDEYEGDVACRNDLIEEAEETVGEYVDETGACPMVEIQVHNWLSEADYTLRSGGYCGHSPLVLDLAGDGVSLTPLAGGVSFDLLGTGTPVECSWTQGDDAFVVYDRDGDGLVAGASELLGNNTAGGRHADGFAALATLDADHDGTVDATDPAWVLLRAWRDDGDGVAEPGELSTLAAVGVSALPVASTRRTGKDAWDGRGNRVPLVGSFVRVGGERGQLVDAWLRYAPAEDADVEVDAMLRRLLGDAAR